MKKNKFKNNQVTSTPVWKSPYADDNQTTTAGNYVNQPTTSVNNPRMTTFAPKGMNVNNARFVTTPYKPGIVTIGKKKVKGMILPPLIVPVKGFGNSTPNETTSTITNVINTQDNDEFVIWDEWVD